MTLNQIVQQLQEIANNHLQVNTWGFGDIWEIAASGDIQYPLNWVTLEGVDVSTSAKTETYKFSLLFMDAVKNGEINETEVLSDQLSIAKDFLAQLKHPSYDWNFQDNVSTLEDFTERFVDSVSGWKMNIAFVLPFTSDRCAMPYVGNVSQSSVCPVVTIYSSTGTIITTVAAGGSYTTTAGSCSGTYQIFVNGVLNQSGTSTNFATETFNITAP
jgi:hypothetical protein